MRVQLKSEGGIAYFPGLNKPRELDSESLSNQETDELKRLVQAARFFELPGKVGEPQRGAADYRQYTITITEGKRSHTIRVTEPVQDAQLQSLLDFIQAHA